jgi:hypothetical protein
VSVGLSPGGSGARVPGALPGRCELFSDVDEGREPRRARQFRTPRSHCKVRLLLLALHTTTTSEFLSCLPARCTIPFSMPPGNANGLRQSRNTQLPSPGLCPSRLISLRPLWTNGKLACHVAQCCSYDGLRRFL